LFSGRNVPDFTVLRALGPRTHGTACSLRRTSDAFLVFDGTIVELEECAMSTENLYAVCRLYTSSSPICGGGGGVQRPCPVSGFRLPVDTCLGMAASRVKLNASSKPVRNEAPTGSSLTGQQRRSSYRKKRKTRCSRNPGRQTQPQHLQRVPSPHSRPSKRHHHPRDRPPARRHPPFRALAHTKNIFDARFG